MNYSFVKFWLSKIISSLLARWDAADLFIKTDILPVMQKRLLAALLDFGRVLALINPPIKEFKLTIHLHNDDGMLFENQRFARSQFKCI